MATAGFDSRHINSAIALDTRLFKVSGRIDRLPTPLAESPSGLFSPPLSRTPSRTGGHSRLSSTSSAPEIEIEIATPGEKTHSFFGSPFSSSAPTPVPPSPRRIPINVDRGTSTPPLSIPQPRSVSDSRTSHADSEHPGPFNSNLSPSIASAPSSVEDYRMPPMARFFPSRVSGDPKRIGEDWTGEYTSLSRSSSLSSTGGFRRDFYSMPTEGLPSAPPTVVSDLSRSSSRSSAYTRDFSSFNPSPVPTHESVSGSTPPPIEEPPLSTSADVSAPAAPSRYGSQATKAAYLTRLAREPVLPEPTPQPKPGSLIGTDEVPLTLVRILGHGAFSSVWLARDTENRLCVKVRGPKSKRRRSESAARQKKDLAVDGLKPVIGLAQKPAGVLHEMDGDGAELEAVLGGPIVEEVEQSDRVVAVKLMDRALCDINDRTRISFIREVEVLRHISHPCIVSYLQSFTTPTHHCLVLEALQGGELFELLNSSDNHARMTEPLLRKMWGELCRAVGWMHGVALVHRDIKLENILLTCNPFATPSEIDLAKLPTPLLKLTDFGLARFIDPSEPLLTTRCGSESYAAPELVIGSKYDGRQTDAWACGVVLYALVTQAMPFDRTTFSGSGSSAEGDAGIAIPPAPARETRRSYLMRIAKAEYSWPYVENGTPNDPGRLATEGVKRVVGKLLVREPTKRATIKSLWTDEWMKGEGSPAGPFRSQSSSSQPIKEEDGDLVDGEGIASVAMEELV